jgi:transposase-like protein
LEGEVRLKIQKQEYTAEFRGLVVRLVKAGQSIGAVARELKTLRNWVKAANDGKLNAVGAKVVTVEQIVLSRLRAENIRLQRQCEILEKQRRTS